YKPMMKLHERVDQSYQQLKQLQSQTRAILLHPGSRYRSVIIAQLINDPEIKTFYYALGPDDVSLQAFIESVTHSLITQIPTFGRHLNMMPHYVYQAFTQHRDIVLEAFIHELEDLSSDPYVLIL